MNAAGGIEGDTRGLFVELAPDLRAPQGRAAVCGELGHEHVGVEVVAPVEAARDVHRSVDVEGDRARVGAGRHDEVITETARLALEDDVHAGIDTGVLDPRVLGDAGAPEPRIVPGVIMAARGQLVETGDVAWRAASGESD